MPNNPCPSTTENDSAIAAALARDEIDIARKEQEISDAALAKSMENEMAGAFNELSMSPPLTEARSTTVNCPRHHSLTPFKVSAAQRVSCDICHNRLGAGVEVYSCLVCNFDVCNSCYSGGRISQLPPPQSSSIPFSSDSLLPPSHMCLIPAEIGKLGMIELLVDTGAQSSVISLSLTRRLNLTDRLDSRHQGVAAGVGRARILGKLHNVSVKMDHVEFAMDFMCLDINEDMLILGLDQMRKFKCIVDLEREVLIFGGCGGVEV